MALSHTIATIHGVMAGVNTITTLHFAEDYVNLAEQQAIAAAIDARWMPAWLTGCAAAMNYIAIVVTRAFDANASPYTLPINRVGGGSTLGVYQACIQWNLQSGLSGKAGKGRLFQPGIHTGAMSGGKIASATKLSLNAELANLNARWTEGGSEDWHLVVFSRKFNFLRDVKVISFNEVFSCLRSRKLGIGI